MGLETLAGTAASMNPYGMAAQAAGGIIKAGIGYFQRRGANKWLKNNKEPMEGMPSEVKKNQELATLRSNTGMPSEQYNNAMKDIQRNQLAVLKKAGTMGGGKALSVLGAIDEQSNNAVGNLNAEDARMRLTNEGTLMNVNNQVAGWKSTLFDRNRRQPWLRTWNQKMNELGAGNQNMMAGADALLSASGEAASQGMFSGAGGRRTATQGVGYDPAWDNYGQPQ